MNQPCKANIFDTNAVFTTLTTKDNASQTYMEMVATLPKCSEEMALRVHPLQTVQLEPIAGTLGIMLADRRVIIKPGKAFEIPKNTEFAFYNADEQEVTFKSTLTPALHTEWLTKELVASAKRWKPGWKRMIERSYIISQIKGEYYRSGLPVAIQNMIHGTLAVVGKMMGVDKKISPVY